MAGVPGAGRAAAACAPARHLCWAARAARARWALGAFRRPARGCLRPARLQLQERARWAERASGGYHKVGSFVCEKLR